MKEALFTYTLAYGGAFVGLFSPFHGLLAYIALAIIRPDALWFWAVPPGGNYSRVVAVAMLIGWLCRGTGSWRLGRAWPTTLTLLFFWIWLVASACSAESQETAWSYVEVLSKAFLPWFVGITTIDSNHKLSQLLWTMVLSIGVLAYEVNRLYFAGYIALITEDGIANLGRAVLGIGLNCGAGVAFFLVIGSKSYWLKALALFLGLVTLHAVFITFSRGAMLGMVVMAVMTFWILPKKPSTYALYLLGGLLALQMVGPQVMERFSSTFAKSEQRDASAQSRFDLWSNCLVLMGEHPVFGLGPEHFALQSQRFGWEANKEAHSLWLQVGAELGIPAMCALAFFYLKPLRRLLRIAKGSDTGDPFLRTAAGMGLVVLCGFILSSSFVTVTRYELPYYVVLAAAATLKLSQASQPPADEPMYLSEPAAVLQ
jgi:O-antigen ligase